MVGMKLWKKEIGRHVNVIGKTELLFLGLFQKGEDL